MGVPRILRQPIVENFSEATDNELTPPEPNYVKPLSRFSELLRTPSHQTLEGRQVEDDLAPITIARLPVHEENEVKEHDIGQVEPNENANFNCKSSLQRITRRDLDLVLANSTQVLFLKIEKGKIR